MRPEEINSSKAIAAGMSERKLFGWHDIDLKSGLVTVRVEIAKTGNQRTIGFRPLLGWLGAFLVGSDTAANALFGNLQVITAGRLGCDPALMAAANSSGGVMGKMISLSSIAVAAAATGMPASDEAKLFRFTLKHSLILVTVIALLVSLYAALGS